MRRVPSPLAPRARALVHPVRAAGAAVRGLPAVRRVAGGVRAGAIRGVARRGGARRGPCPQAFARLLVLPYKWLLLEPGRLLAALDAALPWVLAGVLAFLVLREAVHGWRAVAWAAALLALSGILGLVAGRL